MILLPTFCNGATLSQQWVNLIVFDLLDVDQSVIEIPNPPTVQYAVEIFTIHGIACHRDYKCVVQPISQLAMNESSFAKDALASRFGCADGGQTEKDHVQGRQVLNYPLKP